jgi:hypothetical protein
VPFYQRLLPPNGLANGYVALLDAMDAYAARGMLTQREEVRRLLNSMWAEYEALSVQGAAKSEEIIRRRIRQTAVRPARSGRLEKGIKSMPLQTSLPSGSIGIADIDHLDATVINPRYRRFGPYWRAQEYGLPGLTPADYGGGGRKVAPGYFMPGYSAPAGGQFRVHPYFQQMGYAKGMPALMRLAPVPARHFLRDGTAEFIEWRRREIARINRHAISKLVAI